MVVHTREAEAGGSGKLKDFLIYRVSSRPATEYTARPCLKRKQKGDGQIRDLNIRHGGAPL